MLKRFLCALLCLLFVLTSCSQDTGQASYSAYYVGESPGELTEEKVSLDPLTAEEMATELFALLQTPSDDKLVSPVPNGVSLVSAEVSDGIAKLVLSAQYNKQSAADKAVFHACVTKTLCSVPKISAVSFIGESSSLSFTAEDFILSAPHIYESAQDVNLYFTDAEFSRLIKKTVTVYSTPSESLEEIAVNMLLKDPKLPELRKALPEGTVLNDVYVSNGTCFVDFSVEFVANAAHSYASESVIIFSAVNTLTELPMIDKVQFLIDGKTASGFAYFDLSQPFMNDSKLLS